jgi:PAS domain-containing protein
MRKIVPLDLVETVREGLLVLEPDLTIRIANRSFCHIFGSRQRTGSGASSELGNGQWDVPNLRTALEAVISSRTTIEAFEVDQFFPSRTARHDGVQIGSNRWVPLQGQRRVSPDMGWQMTMGSPTLTERRAPERIGDGKESKKSHL